MNRSALETQKLELMTEVSNLKLKLTAVGGDHRDGEVSCTCSMSAVAGRDPGSRSLIV